MWKSTWIVDTWISVTGVELCQQTMAIESSVMNIYSLPPKKLFHTINVVQNIVLVAFSEL